MIKTLSIEYLFLMSYSFSEDFSPIKERKFCESRRCESLIRKAFANHILKKKRYSMITASPSIIQKEFFILSNSEKIHSGWIGKFSLACYFLSNFFKRENVAFIYLSIFFVDKPLWIFSEFDKVKNSFCIMDGEVVIILYRCIIPRSQKRSYQPIKMVYIWVF